MCETIAELQLKIDDLHLSRNDLETKIANYQNDYERVYSENEKVKRCFYYFRTIKYANKSILIR